MSFQRFCFFCLGCKSKRIRWHHFLILLPFQDKCIKGFRLAYQLAPCSRTYSQPHGRVLSPSWPHRLPRHCNLLHSDQKLLFCAFMIIPQSSGTWLAVSRSQLRQDVTSQFTSDTLLFPHHQTAPLPTWRWETTEYLLLNIKSKVHDGDSEDSPLLTKLCGRALPPSITSRCTCLRKNP